MVFATQVNIEEVLIIFIHRRGIWEHVRGIFFSLQSFTHYTMLVLGVILYNVCIFTNLPFKNADAVSPYIITTIFMKPYICAVPCLS